MVPMAPSKTRTRSVSAVRKSRSMRASVADRGDPPPPLSTVLLRTPFYRQAKYAWTMREVSGPQAGPEAPARPEAPTGPVLPPRGVLRDEVLLVLGLSLAASAVYALVDLLSAPIRGVSAPLFANTALIYQLLDVATSLVPVLLVLHFLGRSRESAASIGLDGSRPLTDLRWGALLLGAARSGLLEEVIICGYLLRRLDQLGWSKGRALWASALLRGAYHLYQGYGGFVGNVVLGLLFGRVYQRRGRTTPLVIAHFLIDAGAGLGYLALRGKVSWLPG